MLPVDILKSDKVEVIGTTIEDDDKDLQSDLKSVRPDIKKTSSLLRVI